ncbi:MAG: ribose-phosphate pyrophosphokinase [Calditrichaeota bacterium]|nr:ribose-phosphate pyrophosphokinase [Calditrichota bacterium]
MAGEMKIFSGSANPELAQKICNLMSKPLGRAQIYKFKEGNVYVKLLETVRRKEVFFIQSGIQPVNDLIMETLFFIDTFRRSSAASITVVSPFFPYTKGDKKDEPRVSIRAKVVSEIVEAIGADRVLTVDLQPPQIQGFFHIPVDNLYAMPIFIDYLSQFPMKDLIIVAPDFGAAKMANNFSRQLKAPVALGSKYRMTDSDKVNYHDLIGDVAGKNILVVDDMIITGETIFTISDLLKARGANKIDICATHGLITDALIKKLDKSPIHKLIITDTIPIPKGVKHKKLIQLSVAPLISEAISSIYNGDPLSKLFDRIEWITNFS